MMSNEDNEYKLQVIDTYLNGKMRRYSLLFSVNGGAFAIATLLADPNTSNLVGGLTLQHLAVGAGIFTLAIGVDTWFWGRKMRDQFLNDDIIFGNAGKIVHLILLALIIAGWAIAALS